MAAVLFLVLALPWIVDNWSGGFWGKSVPVGIFVVVGAVLGLLLIANLLGQASAKVEKASRARRTTLTLVTILLIALVLVPLVSSLVERWPGWGELMEGGDAWAAEQMTNTEKDRYWREDFPQLFWTRWLPGGIVMVIGGVVVLVIIFAVLDKKTRTTRNTVYKSKYE